MICDLPGWCGWVDGKYSGWYGFRLRVVMGRAWRGRESVCDDNLCAWRFSSHSSALFFFFSFLHLFSSFHAFLFFLLFDFLSAHNSQ